VEEYHGGDEGYDGEEEGQQQHHHQKRWYCKTCNRVYAGRYVNRYMASLRIVDHTGDLWLRAFDEAAAPLLGTSAQELSQLKDFVRLACLCVRSCRVCVVCACAVR
jgi:hypothetical protein